MPILTALILGDGACVREDAAAALELFEPFNTIACSNIGIDWEGPVHIWATLHPSPCKDWIGIVEAVNKRVSLGRNRPQIWGHQPRVGIDFATRDWGGSTGLFAVKVALERGFQKIVLAGVPMETHHGHYYAKNIPWTSAPNFHRGWKQNHGKIADSVRSMSGWTRELLGAPTVEWLQEGT
jgi:hypothetical protein